MGSLALPCGTLEVVGNGICGDAQQPRGEGYPPPLEARKIGEGLVEDVGGQILRVVAVAYAARDERVDDVEVAFVKLGKPAGVLLRGLDDILLRRVGWASLQCEFSHSHRF